MIDPNVVNYMSFNQPFAGYPPDYMAQNGQPPQPPPQPYQHFGFTDYNNNNNNNVHSKKNYTKPRRSGSKHDNYKSRTSDSHPPKQNQQSSNSNNLNSLDMTPAQIDLPDGSAVEYVVPLDSNYVQQTSLEVSETSNAAELQCNTIVTSAQTPVEILSGTTVAAGNVENEVGDEVDSAEIKCDLKHDANYDSIAVDREISEAINDRSSIEDDGLIERDQNKDPKTDWTVVQSSADNYVHVNSDGSDHSVSASPEQPSKRKSSTLGEETEGNVLTQDDTLNASNESEILTGSASAELVKSLGESEAAMKEINSAKQEFSEEPSQKISLVDEDVSKEANVEVGKETPEILDESVNPVSPEVKISQSTTVVGEETAVSEETAVLEETGTVTDNLAASGTKCTVSESKEPSPSEQKDSAPVNEGVSKVKDEITTEPVVCDSKPGKSDQSGNSEKNK